MSQSFDSFQALARALNAESVAQAAKLRKASSLPGPKVGPKVAR